MRDVILTALAPIIWGTTYLATTELLPPDRPLLMAVMRVLPLGLLIMAVSRQLPSGIWWWRSLILGAVNFGLFFPLLFVATYRLPGSVIATVGAIQPFIVAILAWLFLDTTPSYRTFIAAGIGLAGVSLLVLGPPVSLDQAGVFAALAATVLLAAGILLHKHWGQPASLLTFIGWQFAAGGIMLIPLTLAIEGPPPILTFKNLLGIFYIGVVGTGIAYILWLRGIQRVNLSIIPFLTHLVPLVALLIDFLFLGRTLSPIQVGGGVLVLTSIAGIQRSK